MKRKGATIEIEESNMLSGMKRKGATIEIEENKKKKKNLGMLSGMKRKGATIEIEESNKKNKPSNREVKRIQISSWNEKSGVPALRICRGKGAPKHVDQAICEEIIMEILSRLPVRSLQRFKCVSTFWEALISDPYFKMTHLNNAKNDPNSQKFLSTQRYIGKDDMFTFYCSSLSLSSVQVFEDVHKLDCPSNCKPLCAWIFASCDGLVLLQVTDTIDDQLLLWNPSTRESIMLPYPQSTLDYCVCGFGYDTTTDDYKILLINLEERSNQNISVEILALKSGCWRNIGKYPSGMSRVMSLMGSGIDTLAFVHGVFHWVGLSQNYTIISFNISNEVYGEIALLKQMCNIVFPDFVQYGTAVFRGMLCFYSTHNGAGLTFRMDVEDTFKLWVMKDYGVKESWTQLLTIKGTNYFYSAIPKYMFVDGEVLLYCKHLVCGGVVCKTSRGPFGLWPEGVINKKGIVYTESLISPRLLI